MMATNYWAFCMCQAVYTYIIKLLNDEESHSLKVKVKSLSRVQLCDPMDCSPPGSSVHGILQAGILEWVAISFSRGST